MRISSNPSDRGQAAFVTLMDAGKRPRVLLDGEEVANVITADEELGEIVRRTTSRTGSFVSDPRRPGSAIEEVVHGRVRISIVHPAPASWR